MAFTGESIHRCRCYGEGDGPNGKWYACPPELCEAEDLLARAEAAEARVRELEAALQPFTILNCFEPNEEGVPVCEGTCPTCKARALLGSGEDKERSKDGS